MRFAALLLFWGAFLSAPAQAQEIQLRVGQAWRFENAPSPEARVLIGRIENEAEIKIVHVAVRGLPDLQRDPAILPGGVVGKEAGSDDGKFWCEYILTPSADSRSTKIYIRHLPIEYSALTSSLTTLESSNVEFDLYFERAWDRWDYLRDEYGLNDPRIAVAREPVSETLKIVAASANRTMSLLERLPEEVLRAMEGQRD